MMTQFPRALCCLLSLLLRLYHTHGGFGPLPNRLQLLTAMYGTPCDCRGGSSQSGGTQTSQIDCSNKLAVLRAWPSPTGGYTQNWECKTKPQVIPKQNNRTGPCPQEYKSCQIEMHSSCYDAVQDCTGLDNATHFKAILTKIKMAAARGDWGFNPSVSGSPIYTQASCKGEINKPVCWYKRAPIHVSDGGGPQDKMRELYVEEKLKEIEDSLFPKINYHSLAFPKSWGMDLDPQTYHILLAPHHVLNLINPALAQDCWLCMALGTPMPLAIPSNSTIDPSRDPHNFTCRPSQSFLVQPLITPNISMTSLQGSLQNDSTLIDMGHLLSTACVQFVNHIGPLFPPTEHIFVCSNNRAYTYIPANWTGACITASLLPDIDIVSGDQPVPVPTLDYIAGRQKRVVTLIPLLVGMDITGTVAMGTAGLAFALDKYADLSNQLSEDVQALSFTLKSLQNQLDSLAEVVLQNR
ncbi:uncharacterized protein LOC134470812 [Cavia porcellus]|uniref:uncharacterized protein LOC134470812 n=1 Tax=Cavia porcellus TaxID=10141 RepID=UPI002FE17F94